MRKILITTKVSENHKRKNLSIVEVINQKGMLARAEKKYCYYVSEQKDTPDPSQFKLWMEKQAAQDRRKKRHISIEKSFDKERGIGHMIYRVIGSFYVVQDLHIFAVVFMHTIKFNMISSKFNEPKTLF